MPLLDEFLQQQQSLEQSVAPGAGGPLLQEFLQESPGAATATEPPAAPRTGSYQAGWGESIMDFLIDQVDPINIAMLAASATGWGLAGKIAPPAVRALATTRLGSTLFAPNSMTARIVRRAAEGLGGAIPFALGEAIESPEPGETRLGNFGRELLALEAMDVLLFMPAGGLVNRATGMGTRRLARQATQESLSAALSAAKAQGMAHEDATAAAFSAVLEAKLQHFADDFGPAATAEMAAAIKAIGEAPQEALEGIVRSGMDSLAGSPEVRSALAQAGIPPTALDDVLLRMGSEREDELAAQFIRDTIMPPTPEGVPTPGTTLEEVMEAMGPSRPTLSRTEQMDVINRLVSPGQAVLSNDVLGDLNEADLATRLIARTSDANFPNSPSPAAQRLLVKRPGIFRTTIPKVRAAIRRSPDVTPNEQMVIDSMTDQELEEQLVESLLERLTPSTPTESKVTELIDRSLAAELEQIEAGSAQFARELVAKRAKPKPRKPRP